MATLLTVRNDIAGQVGGEAIRASQLDASGNPQFRAEAAVSAGYTDITSLENWMRHGMVRTGLDHRTFRNLLIDDFLPNWATLAVADKQHLVKHYVWPAGTTDRELDALYPKSDRDELRDRCMEDLISAGVNSQRSSTAGSEKYFDMRVLDDRTLSPQEIRTDATL